MPSEYDENGFYIAPSVHERLARLEANGLNRDRKLDEIQDDVKILISRFDQLTGGKRALVGIASVAGAVVAGVVGWVSRHPGAH